MRTIGGIILAFLWCVQGLSLAEDRQPVPNDIAQKAAEKLIKEIFAADYSKVTPADRTSLAQKLLKQALETKDDQAARYVLFREASAIASQNGDILTAVRASEELARTYAVDGAAVRLATLDQLFSKSTAAENFKTIAGFHFALADELTNGDQHDKALQALDKGLLVGRRAQDMPLLTKAMARRKEICEAKTVFDGIKISKKKLLESPDDADSNFAVGKYVCIAKGNWETGLPMLVKGSDPKFSEAAKGDLAAAKDANLQIAAGDKWWDLAQGLPKAEADAIKVRTGFWYGKALSTLSGLTKIKVEKRLQEIPALPNPIASAPLAQQAVSNATTKALPTREEIEKLNSLALEYKNKGENKAHEEYLELFMVISNRLLTHPEGWNEADWNARIDGERQITETAGDVQYSSLFASHTCFRVWGNGGGVFAIKSKSDSELLARLKLIGTNISYRKGSRMIRGEKTFRQIVYAYMEANPQAFTTAASKAQFCEWLKKGGINDASIDELQKELRETKP